MKSNIITLSNHGSCDNMIASCLQLTHWGRDKMGAIFQATFSNGYLWMKMHEFGFQFHWSLFLGSNQIFQHWFRQWLGIDQATSHYLNQWWSSSLRHICITWPWWVNKTDPRSDLELTEETPYRARYGMSFVDTFKKIDLFYNASCSVTGIVHNTSQRT